MSFSVVSDGLKRPADEGEAPAPRQVPRLQGPVVELHAPGGAGAVCLHQQEAGRQLLARRVAFCSALFPATPHGALAEAWLFAQTAASERQRALADAWPFARPPR